jgi:hypothetical protein
MVECRRVMKISRHPVSLDRPVGENEDSYFGDFIEDHKQAAPSDTAAADMLKGRIEQVLRTLTYREREIIKLRYGIGDGYTYTLEEVGRIFKVTRERVRQVEAKAIRKLQHPVRARKLQGFVDGSVYKEVRSADSMSDTKHTNGSSSQIPGEPEVDLDYDEFEMDKPAAPPRAPARPPLSKPVEVSASPSEWVAPVEIDDDTHLSDANPFAAFPPARPQLAAEAPEPVDPSIDDLSGTER